MRECFSVTSWPHHTTNRHWTEPGTLVEFVQGALAGPEACSTWFLPRIVGISTAVEWTMGARMVPAVEALERGLVRELVPTETVLAGAIEVAREMVARTAPVSVALTRALMWRMLGAAGPEDAHAAESVGFFTRGASADVREGVEAFLAKREPNFPDRIADGLRKLFG